MRYEYYSNLALVSSAVVYMLAMFAHAAEWAAARRLTVTGPAERELVNVAASDNVRPEPFDKLRTALVEGHDQAGSAAGPQDQTAVSPPRRAVRPDGRSADHHQFLLSVAGVLTRALAAHRAPWGNMFEFTIMAMVFIVGVYLIMVWRAGVRWLGLPVTLLAAMKRPR